MSFPKHPQDNEEGKHLEIDLRWGKNGPVISAIAVAIPQIGEKANGNNQVYFPQDNTEGSNLEFSLRNGKNSAEARDFGQSYWLIVGPAGEKPIDLNARSR